MGFMKKAIVHIAIRFVLNDNQIKNIRRYPKIYRISHKAVKIKAYHDITISKEKLLVKKPWVKLKVGNKGSGSNNKFLISYLFESLKSQNFLDLGLSKP